MDPQSVALSKAEVYDIWALWKAVHEATELSIIAAATAASDLTDAEIAVLLRLEEADGAMRQAELARELGWHRSRLSHQLTRMADRGLAGRSGAQTNVLVAVTDEGSRRMALARPAHLAALRRALIEPLEDPRVLRTALEALRREEPISIDDESACS